MCQLLDIFKMTEEQTQELFSTIQKYLLKMQQIHGQLKHLLSRATLKTSDIIDDLVNEIVEIFHKYKILPEDLCLEFGLSIEIITEQKVADCYRYLLMNTSFSSQTYLIEDYVHGHLADMCPTLSPYLFVQIIYKLRCEELILESILYTPLELCLEILQISTQCITELEFERALRFTINLIWYMYKRCFLLNDVGTQVNGLVNRMEHFVVLFQELLLQLSGLNITIKCSDLVKLERHGIILKGILRATKMCTEVRLTGQISSATEKLYTLTFGGENYQKISADSMKQTVATFDKELVMLLETHIKLVDCNMYMAWVVDDHDNAMLTLQRAIAIECYYFTQFMKRDVTLSQNDHLRECLEQLIGQNASLPMPTLSELRYDIANGRPESMKELIKRRCDWDLTTLEFVSQWCNLLDKDDCQALLEYVHYTYATRYSDNTEEQKIDIQIMILKIIVKRPLSDIYDIMLTYLLRHFDHTFFELYYNEYNFNTFIRRNPNLRDALDLRILLIYLFLSPKRVLSALICIAIGSNVYEGVAIALQDLLFLRPFLRIQRTADCTYLAYILRAVCMENHVWNTKQFTEFLRFMLHCKLTNADDLMNNVFIPYLAEKPFEYNNVSCILINARKLISPCTNKTDMVALCTVLLRKMTVWRNSNSMIPRQTLNEILANMQKLLKHVLTSENHVSIAQRQATIDAAARHCEPLDKVNLTPLALHLMHDNVLETIRDYEKRCFSVRKQLSLQRTNVTFIRNYTTTLKLGREDFIRHMFLHATEEEYLKYSSELALLYWHSFGWTDEMDACENVLRITMEAARIALEYACCIPRDTFITLFKKAVTFCNSFMKVRQNRHHDEKTILGILRKYLLYLRNSTKRTRHSETYDSFLKDVDHMRNLQNEFQVRI